ncbi:hypothetical protein ABPG74_020944 [Tetrahymena malaccensis]
MNKMNTQNSVDDSISILENQNQTLRDQKQLLFGDSDDINCIDQSFSILNQTNKINDLNNQNNSQDIQFDKNKRQHKIDLDQSSHIIQAFQNGINQNSKEINQTIENSDSLNSSFDQNQAPDNYDSMQDSIILSEKHQSSDNENITENQISMEDIYNNDILLEEDSQINNIENDLNLMNNTNQALNNHNSQQQVQLIEQQNEREMNQQLQKIEEDKKNSKVIPNQVKASINNLIQQSDNFSQNFQNLLDVQKYFPNQTNDQQYNQNINNLQQVFSEMAYWPYELQDAQNEFKFLLQKFLRLQRQIVVQILQQLNISYKLETQHLGKYVEDNNNLIEKFQDLQNTFKEKYKQIKKQNFYKSQEQVFKCLKAVFASQLNEDQSKQIEKLNKQYEELKLKKMQEIQSFTKEFSDFQLKNIEIRNDVEFLEKQTKEFQNQVHLLQTEIDQMNIQISSQNNKNKDKIADYLEIINKQKQLLLNQLTTNQQDDQKQQELLFKKQQSEFEKITNKCSILSKSQFASSKNCFHYIFIVDCSGSFESIYNTAVQALVSYAEKIKNNNLLSVIQFDTKASQIFNQKASPCIDKDQLKKALQNPKFGGTSFSAAFQELKKTLQYQVSTNEFPVVLFITDGEDNSDLSCIIQDALNQIDDLIFFTLGYGNSINQQQLKIITDLFNRSSNQIRRINQKEIKLFYNNNTPSSLENDILGISNIYLTIDEVEESRQYITKSIETQMQQYNNFSIQKKDLINSQIQDLINQEKLLSMQLTNEEQAKKFDEIIQQLRMKKQSILESVKQNDYLKLKNEQQIEIEDKAFYIKHFIKNNQQENKQSEQKKNNISAKKQQFDFQKLFQTKVSEINTKFDNQLDSLNQKIMQIYESEAQASQIIQTKIKEYGFENINQFQLFLDFLKKLQPIYMQANNIKEEYILIMDCLIDVSQNLQQCIDFSLNSIEKISIKDTEERILEYYRQLDESISIKDKVKSRQIVLQIQNNTILANCKKQKKMGLYEDCINTIEFSDIQELIESNQAEKENKISENILPKLIKKSDKLMKVEAELSNLQQEVLNIEEEIQNELKNKNPDKNQQTYLKELNSNLKTAKAKLTKKENELNLVNVFYQKSIYEDSKIARLIITSLIQAAHSAQVQLKYQFALKPFQQYILNVQSLIDILNNFKNPSLTTTSQSYLIDDSYLKLQNSSTVLQTNKKNENQKQNPSLTTTSQSYLIDGSYLQLQNSSTVLKTNKKNENQKQLTDQQNSEILNQSKLI